MKNSDKYLTDMLGILFERSGILIISFIISLFVSILFNLYLAGLLGLIVLIFSALVIQSYDTKITDVKEIENSFNYTILAVIPSYSKKTKNLITKTEFVENRFISMMEEQLSFKEAYRKLDAELPSGLKGNPKKIMITSCEENTGKTTFASNLAITIAQANKKVLLIDCNIINPNIANQFGLPNFSSGLIDYLKGKTDTPNIYKPLKLSENINLVMNIDIIPTGVFTNISGEILVSERMKDLLDSLKYYDFVILDTPPINRLSDALSLGRIVENSLLVVRSRQTSKKNISRAFVELRLADTNFVGLVLNDYKLN